jgi:hypothetical protein
MYSIMGGVVCFIVGFILGLAHTTFIVPAYAWAGGCGLFFLLSIALNTLTWVEDEQRVFGASYRAEREKVAVGSRTGPLP